MAGPGAKWDAREWDTWRAAADVSLRTARRCTGAARGPDARFVALISAEQRLAGLLRAAGDKTPCRTAAELVRLCRENGFGVPAGMRDALLRLDGGEGTAPQAAVAAAEAFREWADAAAGARAGRGSP